MENILSKLKNPVILMSTLTNVWILLETLDFLNFCGVTQNTYMKIVGVVLAILIEIGILKNVNTEESIIKK